ncbi:MAG: hypothetical protein Q4D06_03515 [Coriobacteriia bacterium]|nr:hypothetical protein [Coriobacteriia bacterium]
MIANILLIGVGLIVALGGVILLDRERYDRKPRAQYGLASLCGIAMAALPMAGIL